MARNTSIAVLAAATVVLGGLAWWMLGSGDGATESPPSPAPVVTAPSPGGTTAGAPKPVAGLPVGTLLAIVKGEGKPLAATLAAGTVSAATAPEDGSVRLASAPAGAKIRVLVSAPGWRTLAIPDVEVAAGGEKDLGVLELERALPATGRVLDPAGRPVAGATVGAVTAEATSRFDFRRLGDMILNEPDWKAKATTGEDGTFLLDALGPGSWNLVATARGYSPSAGEEVLLHPAGTAPAVELVLQQGHSLVVKVTGTGDSPVAGAEAAAAGTGGRSGLPVSMGPARGITDSGGEARLTGIPPGRTAVAVRASEGRLVVRTVEVPAATTVTIRMEGTAALVVKVRTPEGAPVEGASLMAMVQSGAGGMDSGEALTGRTGADGTARWEHLAPGQLVFVLAEKEGFPPVTPDAGGMMMGREEIKEGGTLEKEIVLKAGATVTGVVRRRPGDSPVPGAKVAASGGASIFVGQPIRATADAEGAYRVEGVPEGRVQISASAEGLAPPEAWSAPGNPFAPQQEGRALPEGFVLVAAGAGEVKKDLYLEETGTVAGRVLGPAGEGMGGARVEISSERGLGFRGFFGSGGTDHHPGPVLTAPDGTFLVKGVPAGQNLVARASMPAFIAAASPPFPLAAGGSATAVEIRLTEGGVLAGRVTSASGAPVPGAKVRAFSRAPGRPEVRELNFSGRSSTRLEATTGAEGTWRIATVLPGTASVFVEAEGFVDVSRGDLSVAAGTETRADVSLEPGRVIAGVVKDAAGAPVEGARVMARPAGNTPPASMRFRNGVTDATGAFRLTGLPSANFILTVNAQGHAAKNLTDVAAGSEALEIRLPPAVRMTGKVVDFEGNPAPGARVTAASEGPDRVAASGVAGPEGAFSVEGLVAGTFRVTATGRDQRFGQAVAKGVAGDATDVLLTLPRALEIRGKVVGPDGGVPAEKGFLFAMDPSGIGRSSGRVQWEEDGTFVLAGLSDGSYTIRAMVPGKLEGTATATGGQSGVTIRLEPAKEGGGGNPTPLGPVEVPRPPR